MKIQRVARDLVSTEQVTGLGFMSLQVVEDDRGNVEVATDPVGTKPGDFVFTISTSAARYAAGDATVTTDLTIGGIIDHWTEERWRS